MAKKPVEKRTHKRSVNSRKAAESESAHICTHPRQAARRSAAAERLIEWQALSIDQQLQELDARPGNCGRQVARLNALKKTAEPKKVRVKRP